MVLIYTGKNVGPSPQDCSVGGSLAWRAVFSPSADGVRKSHPVHLGFPSKAKAMSWTVLVPNHGATMNKIQKTIRAVLSMPHSAFHKYRPQLMILATVHDLGW